MTTSIKLIRDWLVIQKPDGQHVIVGFSINQGKDSRVVYWVNKPLEKYEPGTTVQTYGSSCLLVGPSNYEANKCWLDDPLNGGIG